MLFLADAAQPGLSYTSIGPNTAGVASSTLLLSPDHSMVAVRWRTVRDEYGLSVYAIPSLSPMVEISLVGTEAAGLLSNYAPEFEGQRPPLQNALEWAPGAFMWSPNARYLAFAGAIDGSSTDVYIFDVERSEIRQLTSGRDQTYLISWSPDSQWIVHASYDDVSVGIGVRDLWAVSPVSGAVSHLYNVEPNAMNVNILGWVDDSRFLSQSAFFEACAGAVRQVTVPSGETSTILSQRNTGADFDVSNRLLLFVQGPSGYFCGSDEPGIYSFDPRSGETELVTQGDYFWADYSSQLGAFITEDTAIDTMKVITATGRTLLEVPGAAAILPSPSGQLMAVDFRDHLAIYSKHGSIVAEISPIVGSSVRWLPDDKGLLNLTRCALSVEWDLYLASAGWQKASTMRIPFTMLPGDILLAAGK